MMPHIDWVAAEGGMSFIPTAQTRGVIIITHLLEHFYTLSHNYTIYVNGGKFKNVHINVIKRGGATAHSL